MFKHAATDPATLAMIALFVGGIVRLMKGKRASAILDAFPAAWVKAIPARALPWIAVALGVVVTAVDARLNGGLTSWREAIFVAISGVLAGGTAVAGHETVAKLAKKKAPPTPPTTPASAETLTPPPVITDTKDLNP